MDKKTHFGEKEVNYSERQGLVNQVFHNTSMYYDVMNDIMSVGLHRFWKNEAIKHLMLKSNHVVCDIAAGSGDLTSKILDHIDSGLVYMTDINNSMLNLGYNRVLDSRIDSIKVIPVIANGEELPFKDKVFDRIICGFGIRNMTNMGKALSEFNRCLVPGGRLVILEFSQVPDGMLKGIYEFYTMNIIPAVGAIVAGDRDSYKYLVESIRKHPNQQDFAQLMISAGFSDVSWRNLSFGAVAIHIGIKI